MHDRNGDPSPAFISGPLRGKGEPSERPDTRRPPSGPLAGLRVVEFAAIGPVPLAGMLMADLGADVVRIDRTSGSGLGVAMTPRFDVNARGRRSLALDLKQPAAVAAVQRLVDRADVLLEGFRPGVLERLGFAPADCQARNPGLVVGRMTGFGQTGPLAPVAGHDLNYIALSGLLHAIGPGEPDGGKPVPPLNLVGDYGGGAMFLAFGVLAALFERQRSRRGQVVDAAMVDGASTLASIFFGLTAAGSWNAGARAANLLDGGAPFYDCYACADGRWLSIAALEPKFFAELVRLIGLDDRFIACQHDRGVWPEMRQAIAAQMKTRSRDEWSAVLEGSDACVAPVLDFAEASAHPHATARSAFNAIDGVMQPAPAPRFDRTPTAAPRRAPEIGEHSDAVLREAGLSASEIAALHAAGAVLQWRP